MPQLIPPVLHPLVVHFPIVLIPTAAAMMTYTAWKRPAWARWIVLILIGGAAVSGFVADQLGDHDWHNARARASPQTRALEDTHEELGSLTWQLCLAATAITWFARKWIFGTRWAWAWAVLFWGLFALVTVTAWYGGALVYEQGVNTP